MGGIQGIISISLHVEQEGRVKQVRTTSYLGSIDLPGISWIWEGANIARK